MSRLPNAAPKPRRKPKKVRTPIRRSRVRQKAGKPKRFRARRDEAYTAWIREQRCAAGNENCDGPIEAAHIKTRGAGGSDRNNMLPLCRSAHQQQHRLGIQTWAKYAFPMGGMDEMLKLARDLTERYDRERSVG